ncbi:MAG: dTDP-4-dehydrorhamnose reductase [Synergistaceae bacterium]|nr:dTDP-4-dehydrorhamnose reductase [Synergistaceae bacterium]
MKIFLTGAYGQVGWELNRTLLPYGEIYACDRDTLDLLDASEVRRVVRDFGPSVIINSAAYTAVDRAESDRDLCDGLNISVPGVLAEEAERLGAWMVHFSSDYVFNGKNDRPWTEDDAPEPVNYYGRSKLGGDIAVMKNASRYIIFRTSWVYAARGSNFILSMLRLFAQKDELRIVDDQIGAPTWARYIAQSVAMALRQVFDGDGASLSGVYNLVAAGRASWYNFARAIRDYAGGFAGVNLAPVSSDEYQTAAARPKWSVLSTEKIQRVFGVYPPYWMDSMKLCIDEIIERQRTK